MKVKTEIDHSGVAQIDKNLQPKIVKGMMLMKTMMA